MRWLMRLFGKASTPEGAVERKREQADRLAERLAERLALRIEDRERRLAALRATADLFREEISGGTGERRTH
jgi:hypothetical protein